MNLLSLAAYDLKLCCVSVCLSTLRESLRQYLALKDNHHSLNVILGILFSSHTPPRMYSRCYFCNKISIFSSYFHLVQVCKLQNTLLARPGMIITQSASSAQPPDTGLCQAQSRESHHC